ncbi:MAG: CRISPR-associated endonuclease Cas1 [Chitinophagales bacterium]|nr:CRISPR-associated endonuclease Cas1 [Chitinophagales bacterium]
MQLVLNTYGLQLSQRNRCFQVESNSLNRIISPQRISSILITKAVNITSSAMILAAENNIPLILLDHIGQPVVRINSVLSSGHSDLRKKQYEFSKSKESLKWIMQMLLLKTEGQLKNINWWANRKTALAKVAESSMLQIITAVKNLEQKSLIISEEQQFLQWLRGWEGNNAKYYWQVVSLMAQSEGWNMQGRSYRPAGDAVNAMLNYIYGMLYHQVETALACAGLDSQISIWHANEYQTPSLAFDVIEPFRPKADQLLAQLIMRQTIQPDWFETNEKYGYILNKKGRSLLIPFFNDWLEEKTKFDNRVTAMKNHILQLAYDLKKQIEKNFES